MAHCPACGGSLRLLFRGAKPWRYTGCGSLLRLGGPYDTAHPLILPLVLIFSFLRDLEAVECSPDYCPVCRYNLTGNVSGVCPECGTPIGKRPPGPVP